MILAVECNFSKIKAILTKLKTLLKQKKHYENRNFLKEIKNAWKQKLSTLTLQLYKVSLLSLLHEQVNKNFVQRPITYL